MFNISKNFTKSSDLTYIARETYTGYNIGNLVPYNQTIDGWLLWGSYAYEHLLLSGGFGPRNIAARFPTTGEHFPAGSNNSKYSIMFLSTDASRGSRDKLKTTFYQKCPTSGWDINIKDTSWYDLWNWGDFFVECKWPAPLAEFGLRKGVGGYLASLSYTFVAGNWYKFVIDCYKNVSGYCRLTISLADGSASSSVIYYGDTGNKTDSNHLDYATWPSHNMMVFSLAGYTASDYDTQYFGQISDVGMYI